MAHRKAGGTARSLHDSNPKYLGTKVADGQKVKTGGVIVRQRGTKIMPGENVGLGRDHSLYALTSGVVKFTSKNKVGFNGKKLRKKVANVVPAK